jgi:hypothetical protein
VQNDKNREKRQNVDVNFSEFSKKIYPNLSGITSQGRFVGALFNAAGSTFFHAKPSYGTDDNQKKLYSGARKFNKKMKDSFPTPIDPDGLTNFFVTRIGDSAMSKAMADFGIPANLAQDKNWFAVALCVQFQSIVSDVADDVDDIVLREYRRLLEGESFVDLSPLYPGDNLRFIKEEPEGVHELNTYKEFDHAWTIKNNGTVSWQGRCLVCANQATMSIKTMDGTYSVAIPDAEPGDEVRIAMRFNSRGNDGRYESIWEMKDSDGQLCFPNKDMALKVVANVIFTPTEVEVANG